MKLLSHVRGKVARFFDSKLGVVAGLALSICAFLSLTLTRLTSSSIWFDESYSAYLMRFNWTDLTHYTAVDVHPPFYYYLLKIWTNLFGNNPVALRSMSIFFGITALILLFILIKRLFNRKSALLATFLVAISPMFVRYGIEARMYMVVVCIVLTSAIALQKALQSNRWRDWIVYGLLVCLGMYTHYFTAVVWLSFWIYRLIYLYQQKLRGRKLLKTFFDKRWLIIHLLAIVAYLPWLPIAYHQFTGVSQGFWIPAITVNTPGDLWADIMMYMEGWRADGWYAMALFSLFSIVLILLIKFYKKSDKDKKRGLAFLITMAVCPVALLMLMSCYPFKSVFIDRYLMPSIIAIVTLIGISIAYTKNKHLAFFILTAILACFSFGIYNVYHYGNYNRYGGGPDKVTLTGELMKQINAIGQPGEPVIAAMSYGYYEAAVYDSTNHPVYYLYNDVKNDNTGSLQMLRDNKLNKAIINLNEFTKQHPRIWRIGSNSEDKIAAPDGTSNWHAVKTITTTDPISGVHNYKATLYEIN